MRSLDDTLFRDLNEFARDTSWLHGPALAFASYGILVFAILMLAGLWWARARDSRALAASAWAPVGMLVALGLNQVVAGAVNEARPYTRFHDILVLAQRTTDSSFPSDHAVMAGAVAAGLWLLNRRLGLVAWAAALVMAVVRVYVAAHYPWDVVAGLAFGAAVSGALWLLLRMPLTSFATWLRSRGLLATVFPDPVPTQGRATRSVPV